MLFKSYEDAHRMLELPGSHTKEINGTDDQGISSLKITDHPDTYHRCTHSDRLIHYVGVGRTRSPGHPAGNQSECKQFPFRRSWVLQNPFPVLRKRYDETVVLLGYYYVDGISKRVGNEGFAYFQILLRQIVEKPPAAPAPAAAADINRSRPREERIQMERTQYQDHQLDNDIILPIDPTVYAYRDFETAIASLSTTRPPPATATQAPATATVPATATGLGCYRCDIIQNLFNGRPIKGISFRNFQ